MIFQAWAWKELRLICSILDLLTKLLGQFDLQIEKKYGCGDEQSARRVIVVLKTPFYSQYRHNDPYSIEDI